MSTTSCKFKTCLNALCRTIHQYKMLTKFFQPSPRLNWSGCVLLLIALPEGLNQNTFHIPVYMCNTHTFWNIYWHIEIYGKLGSIYFTLQKAFPTRLTIVMACASSWEPELRVDECQLDVNRAQNRPKKLRPGTKKVLSSAHKKVSQGGALLCGRSCLGGGTGSGAVSEVVAHGEEEVRQMAPTAVNMECPASGETRLQELAADVRALLPGSSLLLQDLYMIFNTFHTS